MAYIRCAACQSPMPDSLFQGSAHAACQACGKAVSAFLFPALHRPITQAPPTLDMTPPAEGEAACFYNANRKATKVCNHCGVFISDAWAAQWGTETICLKCLDQLRAKSKTERFEAGRTLWDNVALGLIVVPFVVSLIFICTLILYFMSVFTIALTFITAPAAIFVAMRHWNSPRSLVPRGRLRLIMAIGLALLVVASWIVGIWYLIDFFANR